MENFGDRLRRILAEKKKKVVPIEVPKKPEVTDELRNEAFSNLIKEIERKKEDVNKFTDEFYCTVYVDDHNVVNITHNQSKDRVELFLDRPENSNLKLFVARYEETMSDGVVPPEILDDYEIAYFSDELGFRITDSDGYSTPFWLTEDLFEWFLYRMEAANKR